MIFRLKNILAHFKICIQRSATYLQIVNSGMILFIFLRGLDLTIIEKGLIFLFTIGLMILIGFMDIKLKIFEREQSLFNKSNPEIQELLKNVKTNYKHSPFMEGDWNS